MTEYYEHLDDYYYCYDYYCYDYYYYYYYDVMSLKASPHGFKKKAGGLGEVQHPPFANTTSL